MAPSVSRCGVCYHCGCTWFTAILFHIHPLQLKFLNQLNYAFQTPQLLWEEDVTTWQPRHKSQTTSKPLHKLIHLGLDYFILFFVVFNFIKLEKCLAAIPNTTTNATHWKIWSLNLKNLVVDALLLLLLVLLF